MQKLLVALNRLSLISADDFREITGVLRDTFLVDAKGPMAVAMLRQGKDYPEAAKSAKDDVPAQVDVARGDEHVDACPRDLRCSCRAAPGIAPNRFGHLRLPH